MATTSALVLERPGRLESRTFTLPPVSDDDGLLRVEAKEARRVAILAAAKEVFADKGFHAMVTLVLEGLLPRLTRRKR